jgi:integrase
MGLSAREAVVWLLPSDGPRSYNRRGASQEGLCQARPQNQNDQVTKRTGQNLGGRVQKDGSVTFEWFVLNRYFPLRKGDWRPETAKEKMAQIRLDLIDRFGDHPLDSFDKFMMQTHLNGLAERYSQDRVKQARSYLKSIFDEAIEQEYLAKDPTRKLRIPRNLRPKDKQVLSWEQLWLILANAGRRDRLLLMLDMTEALRPSELFALRWRSFDDQNTLTLTETVYRRTLRPFGKTPGSLTKVHLPDGLADELIRWKMECKQASCKNPSCRKDDPRKASPDAFISRTPTEASWTLPTTGAGFSSLWRIPWVSRS